MSTDPPYYDNIGYADLSDFFYVWLRRSLKSVFPDTLRDARRPEGRTNWWLLQYRHGNKDKAETFLPGRVWARPCGVLPNRRHPGFPVTIYYAFKQSETSRRRGHGQHRLGDVSGCRDPIWFHAITGTWPMRTELASRMIGIRAANALASSPSSSSAAAHPPTHRWPPVASSSRPSNLNCRWPWLTCSAATSPGRSRAGGHRPGHGGLHPLRQGARRRGQGSPVRMPWR